MKIKSVLFYILVICSLTSCNDGVLKDSEIKETREVIFNSGDKYSYAKICIYFDEKGDYESSLPYSIVMAYKYNDKDAYYNIYRTMIRINNSGEFDYKAITKLDKTSKAYALENLTKSANLGCISAKMDLEKYHSEEDKIGKKTK